MIFVILIRVIERFAELFIFSRRCNPFTCLQINLLYIADAIYAFCFKFCWPAWAHHVHVGKDFRGYLVYLICAMWATEDVDLNKTAMSVCAQHAYTNGIDRDYKHRSKQHPPEALASKHRWVLIS